MAGRGKPCQFWLHQQSSGQLLQVWGVERAGETWKKKWQFEIKWCCFWDTLGKFWLYFLSASSFICATAVCKCQSAAEFEIMLPYFILPNCTFWIFDIPNNYYKTVWKVWCNHTPRMYIQCQICEATQHHFKKKRKKKSLKQPCFHVISKILK